MNQLNSIDELSSNLVSLQVTNRYFCLLRLCKRVFGLGSGCVVAVMAAERYLALVQPVCRVVTFQFSFLNRN